MGMLKQHASYLVIILCTATVVSMVTLRDADARSAPRAGLNPYIGEIMWFGGTFAPQGFAKCDGQLLPIASNMALFSILGTTYGGDGRTTFGLPDLRGRVSMHSGTGPGLTQRNLGAKGGLERVNLGIADLPPHSHTLNARTGSGTKMDPAGNLLSSGRDVEFSRLQPNSTMAASAIGMTGGGLPHDNVQPYTVLTACIALVGIFPSEGL